MNLYQKFVANVQLRRWIVLLLIILLLYFLRAELPLILLTFIFIYLTMRFAGLLKKYLKIPLQVGGVILYLVIVFLIYLAITIYVPQLISGFKSLVKTVIKFYQSQNQSNNSLLNYIYNFIKENDILAKLQSSASTILNYLYSFGEGVIITVLAFLMGLFYVLDHRETEEFSQNFFKGQIPWLFEDIYYLGERFVRSFGVALETQFIIAVINTILTTVALAVINFPQLKAFAILIFLMSLIPVAGVFISSAPLLLVSYTVGGLNDLIYVIIVVIAIHCLEAYVLNPRLMASRTKTPMFYTFVMLLLGEHLFGVWGLIVAVPIFTFLLDLLDIKKINEKILPIKNKKSRSSKQATQNINSGDEEPT